MNLASVILPEDVILDRSTSTKAALLKRLAAHAAARTGLGEEAIHAAILGRERLGSTGIGQGVAMPHAPVAGLAIPFAALAILKKPLDFESVDDLPVDIVFLLLTGSERNGDDLKILAAVARRTRNESRLLRSARSAEAAHAILVGSSG